MADMVMVGVDGSGDSAAALRWAAQEAARRKVPLQIVFCLQLPSPFGAAPLDAASFQGHAEEVLEPAAAQARESAPEVEVSTQILTRPATAGLLEASSEVSVIVLGTRGHGAIGSLVLGSVSTRVSARASCPTVVVPPGSEGRTATGPIVVGVDGSGHSDKALRFALERAARNGNRLTVVHGRPHTRDADLAGADADDVIEGALSRVGREQYADVEVQTLARDSGPADAVIAASRDASLTVVGSRGRGGFTGMLLGSVSQTVLHRAENPVAVVHDPDDADR